LKTRFEKGFRASLVQNFFKPELQLRLLYKFFHLTFFFAPKGKKKALRRYKQPSRQEPSLKSMVARYKVSGWMMLLRARWILDEPFPMRWLTLARKKISKQLILKSDKENIGPSGFFVDG
jgi:hypothetical protein